MKNLLWPVLLTSFVVVSTSGCQSSAVSSSNEEVPSRSLSVAPFVNDDISVELQAVLGTGHEQTLVRADGWSEFVLVIVNRSQSRLTLRDVKILSSEGRYQKSAATYAEITQPPRASTEVAGTVARAGTGVALSTIIPFGGILSGVLWSAASATSAEGRAAATRAFNQRVLKAVELAPNGKAAGSAFLANIPNAKSLIVDYSVEGRSEYVDLPLRVSTP